MNQNNSCNYCQNRCHPPCCERGPAGPKGDPGPMGPRGYRGTPDALVLRVTEAM